MPADLSWWSFLAFGMLPLPLILIGVLSSPAPRQVRRGVLWFVQQVLSFEMRRPFEVVHVALLSTGASLIISLHEASHHQQQAASLEAKADPNILVGVLVKKFRSERNAWISAFALAAWVMLIVTHKTNKEKHELRGRLLAAEGRPSEAAREVDFLGPKREAEMRELGREAAARQQQGLGGEAASVAGPGDEEKKEQ